MQVSQTKNLKLNFDQKLQMPRKPLSGTGIKYEIEMHKSKRVNFKIKMLHSTFVDGVDVDIIFFLPHVSLDGAEVWAALRGAVAPLPQYIASVASGQSTASQSTPQPQSRHKLVINQQLPVCIGN